MTKPNILFYDIETPLNLAYLFGCGKQVVGHTQLVPGYSTWGILCISYCWNDGKNAKSIVWNKETKTAGVVEKFDKIITKADIAIGKNSDRFDTKMINFQRALAGLPGMPDWTKYTDDLEKQLRRHFRMPSQSLDYISQQFGLGGKDKMAFTDWTEIHQYMQMVEFIDLSQETKEATKLLDDISKRMYNKNLRTVLSEGRKALKKMYVYCNKDVEDTRNLWNLLSQHFEPKLNMATFLDKPVCRHCGGIIHKHDKRPSGQTMYQRYKCTECGKMSRAPISKVFKKEGKIK